MKSALDARAGVVYFMERVDGTRRTFKIGWTDRSVDVRRQELEAQYGARLVVVHTVETPAAPFLEGYLHRRNALIRIDREWFNFSDAAISDAIGDAAKLNGRIDADVARRARSTAQTVSSGLVRPVGPEHPENAEVLVDFAEVPALIAKQVELEAEQMDISAELSIATGACCGIDGVTQRTRVSPTPTRFQDRLRAEAGAAAARYELPPDHAAFAFLVRGEAARRHEDHETTRDEFDERMRPRDGAAEDAHRRYLRADAELAAVEAQLGLKELTLRAALGSDEGFEGVCAYVRKPAVDWERVQREDPGLFERCTRGRAGSVRFSVIPYRRYL
jgi:hypothetical protein